MQLKNLKITAMGGDCEKTATIRNGRRNFGSKGWSLGLRATLGSLLVSFFLAFGKGVQGVEPPASYLLIAAKKASFFSCKKSLLLYLRMRRRAWSRN